MKRILRTILCGIMGLLLSVILIPVICIIVVCYITTLSIKIGYEDNKDYELNITNDIWEE